MSFVDEIKLFTVKVFIVVVAMGTLGFLCALSMSVIADRVLDRVKVNQGQLRDLAATLENLTPEQIEKLRRNVAVFVEKTEPLVRELTPIAKEMAPLLPPSACSGKSPNSNTTTAQPLQR